MALYKRGAIWWAEFVLNGERHQFSTQLKNRRHAKDYADTLSVELVKGNIGILDRKPVPKLADF